MIAQLLTLILEKSKQCVLDDPEYPNVEHDLRLLELAALGSIADSLEQLCGHIVNK